MLSVEQHATVNLVRRMVGLEPLSREQLEQQLDWSQEPPGNARETGLRRLGGVIGWELGAEEANGGSAYMVAPTQRLGTAAYHFMGTRSVRLGAPDASLADIKYGVVLSGSLLRLLKEATTAMQQTWDAQ